jgi:hypothetical protein
LNRYKCVMKSIKVGWMELERCIGCDHFCYMASLAFQRDWDAIHALVLASRFSTTTTPGAKTGSLVQTCGHNMSSPGTALIVKTEVSGSPTESSRPRTKM